MAVCSSPGRNGRRGRKGSSASLGPGCGTHREPRSRERTLYFRKTKPPPAFQRGESNLMAEKYRKAGKCHKSEETGPDCNPGAPRAIVCEPAPAGPPLWPGPFIPARCVNTGLRAAGQRSVCCVGHRGPRRSSDLGPERCLSGCQRRGKNVGLPPSGTSFSAAANSK